MIASDFFPVVSSVDYFLSLSDEQLREIYSRIRDYCISDGHLESKADFDRELSLDADYFIRSNQYPKLCKRRAALMTNLALSQLGLDNLHPSQEDYQQWRDVLASLDLRRNLICVYS